MSRFFIWCTGDSWGINRKCFTICTIQIICTSCEIIVAVHGKFFMRQDYKWQIPEFVQSVLLAYLLEFQTTSRFWAIWNLKTCQKLWLKNTNWKKTPNSFWLGITHWNPKFNSNSLIQFSIWLSKNWSQRCLGWKLQSSSHSNPKVSRPVTGSLK